MHFQFCAVGAQWNASRSRNRTTVGYDLLNHHGGRAKRSGLIDKHTYWAFAAGKPDFSLGREDAGRLLAAIHLQGLQPIRNSVKHQRNGARWLVPDGIQFGTAYYRDPVGTTHPQIVVTVLEQFVNARTRKTLRHGVVGKFSGPPAIQARSTGSEPQSTVGVLVDGPHFFAFERFRSSVMRKAVTVQTAHAPLGADPYISVSIFQERSYAEVGQAITHLIVGEALRSPTAHSFIRADPDTAIAALKKSADEIVNHSGVMHQARTGLAVDSLALGANPELALTVAEYVPDPHATDAGKPIRGNFAIVKTKQVHGRNPDIAVMVLIYRLRI